MAKIPVVINERSSLEARVCVTHGTTMNCPTQPCPGVPLPNHVSYKHGHEINVQVLQRAVAAAVRTYLLANVGNADADEELDFDVDGVVVLLRIGG